MKPTANVLFEWTAVLLTRNSDPCPAISPLCEKKSHLAASHAAPLTESARNAVHWKQQVVRL